MLEVSRVKPALWIAAALGVVLPASASAATTVGGTFLPSVSCSSPATSFQTTSPGDQYAVPADGVITSWSFRAAASPPQLKFMVARPAPGTPNAFTISGKSALKTPAANTLNKYPIRILVEGGDVIGMHAATDGACGRVAAGYDYHSIVGDQALGTTSTYTPLPGAQFGIAARLEADADGDGFGDESQDQCATDASTQGPCPDTDGPDTDPPQTAITKGTLGKTDRSRVKFKFISDEPDSTFECKLDRKPFKPCTSPKNVKHLDEGKHKFKVRAVDAAGNVDPSAAKDKFKVVG